MVLLFTIKGCHRTWPQRPCWLNYLQESLLRWRAGVVLVGQRRVGLIEGEVLLWHGGVGTQRARLAEAVVGDAVRLTVLAQPVAVGGVGEGREEHVLKSEQAPEENEARSFPASGAAHIPVRAELLLKQFACQSASKVVRVFAILTCRSTGGTPQMTCCGVRSLRPDCHRGADGACQQGCLAGTTHQAAAAARPDRRPAAAAAVAAAAPARWRWRLDRSA